MQADTSYLLIQGPFGSLGALETFQWKVNYQSGSTFTGSDLLNSVFGVPTSNGTYTDGFSTIYEYLTAGNVTRGVGFIDFGGGALFPESFTLNSIKVAMDVSYSPGWNYYVAGGSGSTSYDGNGVWTYSNDGVSGRTISDGSFDGWVFGSTGTYDSSFNQITPPDSIVDILPVVGDFVNATTVPEPSAAWLVVAGGALLVGSRVLRKKHRA